MTKQRKLILDIINSSDRHLTAEEVFFIAKEQMPGIAMATVYNNLNYLSCHNLIRRLNIKSGTVIYDKSIVPHEHVICDTCGKRQDFVIDGFPDELEQMLHSKIENYELTVHIICDECMKNAPLNKLN